MAEETKKKAPAKKTEAKTTAPKVAKAAAPKAPRKGEKNTKSGGTVTVIQVGSPIAREGSQRATLIGLGLNKLHRTRTLEDTPCIRGMISKVQHLVRVVETAA